MRLSDRKATAALVTVLALASTMSLLVAAAPVSAYTPVTVSLDTPDFVGTSQMVACTLTITGGPESDQGTNYSYKAEIVAKNATGSSVVPSTGASATGVFSLNITMPGEAQTIKVKINATAKGEGTSESAYMVREFEIKVVQPIEIEVTVYNTGAADAKGASATFYADGILLGIETFDVAAGSSTEVRHDWIWANIADGKHVVTVVLDEKAGLVEFSDGNNVLSQTIYVGEQSNPIGAVLTIGVIMMSVLVALTVMAKPAKRRK